MAKSRAQRKAEAAKKRQQQLEDRARQTQAKQAKAQHDTQVPESGDVAEVEAAMEAGAAEADQIAPGPTEGPVESASPTDALSKEERRAEKRRRRLEEKERERKARESAARRAPKEEKRAPTKERGRVMTFFASVMAELRKVQWPDRDTLVQASAVTIIFVAVAAAYLGVLDALFGWLVDQLIT